MVADKYALRAAQRNLKDWEDAVFLRYLELLGKWGYLPKEQING